MRKLPCITPRARVEIRGVYGQPVFEFFQQVRAILALKAVNKDLGQFFAEPQLNAAKGEIHWYSEVQGAVQAYSQLDTVARHALDRHVLEIRQRICEAGERFALEGGSASGNRTEIFRAMLSATDLERCLFLVGTQPVLCEWGCKPVGEGARPVDLWAYAAAAANQEKAVQPGKVAPGVATAPSATDEGALPPPHVEVATCGSERQSFDAAPRVQIQDQDLPQDDPAATPEKKAAAAATFTPASSSAPSVGLAPRADSPDRTGRPDSGKGPQYHYLGPRTRSFTFGELLKKFIIAVLLLVLVLLLMRGCSDNRTILLTPQSSESKGDAALLRKEIGEMRRVMAEVVANCPVEK